MRLRPQRVWQTIMCLNLNPRILRTYQEPWASEGFFPGGQQW